MTTPTSSQDPDLSTIAPRVVAIITGAVMLKMGLAVSSMFPPIGNTLSLLAMGALYGGAFVLLIAGTIGINFSRWGRPLGYCLLGVSVLTILAAYDARSSGVIFGTDAILFSQYGVDLLLAGENPYAHSMGPAFEQYNVADEFTTYKRDGTIVKSFSYPALSLLAFVPQALIGLPNLNLTSVVVVLACLAYLVYVSPREYAVAPFAVMFADPSILAFSLGGVFDILWVFPLLIGMRSWARAHYVHASFIFGLAFAVKQTPWFIAPFLAIWLYYECETLSEVLTSVRNCMAAGLAGFLLPNLPFIIWNPIAWAESVLTPVTGGGVALVKQGQGLVLVTVSGTAHLPKSFYTLCLLLVLVLSLIVYALYYDNLKWAIWIVPVVILWFNYRSLQNYFVYFVPVAYLALVLSLDDPQSQTSNRDLWTPHRDLTAPRRRNVLVAVVLFVGAIAGIAGTTMAADSTLDVDATVTNSSDPTGLHRVSQLTISVTNHEDSAIDPKFHLLHTGSQTHSYWKIQEGPKRLAPGASATYVVQPVTTANAIPYGGSAVVGMNDNGTERGLSLDTITFESKPYDQILNPEFRHWTAGAFDTHSQPARWTASEHSPGPETTTVERVDAGARVAVANITREEGAWEMAGVQQEVPFPKTLHIDATPKTVVEEPSKHPPRAAGIELGDRDHRLWVVFADVEERTVVTREGDLDYTFVYVPATPGERVTASIDVETLYQQRGWNLPPRRSVEFDGAHYNQRRGTLLAFAATYPESGESAEVVFHSVNSTGFDGEGQQE